MGIPRECECLGESDRPVSRLSPRWFLPGQLQGAGGPGGAEAGEGVGAGPSLQELPPRTQQGAGSPWGLLAIQSSFLVITRLLLSGTHLLGGDGAAAPFPRRLAGAVLASRARRQAGVGRELLDFMPLAPSLRRAGRAWGGESEGWAAGSRQG